MESLNSGHFGGSLFVLCREGQVILGELRVSFAERLSLAGVLDLRFQACMCVYCSSRASLYFMVMRLSIVCPTSPCWGSTWGLPGDLIMKVIPRVGHLIT